MDIQSLNGNWQVRQFNFEEWLPACVPGGIHTDLLAAGRIPDPFYGDNEKAVQWVAEKDWVYRRYFYPSPALIDHEHISLVLSGVDTLAEVRLNGKILGAVDNAFRTWEWDVIHILRPGENVLEILFRSPLAYIRGRERMRPMSDLRMGIPGGPHLRKPPSHFGWDWGPKIPCIGIWREVRLEGRSRARIIDARIEQLHEHTEDPGEDLVTLTARVNTEIWAEKDVPLNLHMRVTAPDGSLRRAKMPLQAQAALPLKIFKPQIWWPNGLGEHPLYTIDIELVEGDPGSESARIVDTRRYTIGLREIELRQQEDAWGKSFSFVVNGVPVFCKGANWIPADSFPTRVTGERYEKLIRSAAEANHNMLRVWGGGYYEDDCFYDLCDRYGILVWQDFMFACYTYPLDDPAYVDTVRCEVHDNIHRLRHHACLALWCGNNEIETMAPSLGWLKKFSGPMQGYENFFYHILPQIVSSEDPGRPYWPSSPSSNDVFQSPNGEKNGDAHLWNVYHAFRPPEYYRKQNPRFASEFGMQSLPPMETLASFTATDDLRTAKDVQRPVMRLHQRAKAGNSKLVWYIAQRFRLPRSLDGLIYLSQVLQAEAIRIGVEHWRRHPDRTAGALYWQLNDCWPVISWAGIDYYGRWKALMYASRRFFAPLALSVEEVTEKGQRRVNVWLSNDLPAGWEGRLCWTLETLDGEVLEGGNQQVRVGPVSAECVLQKDFAKAQTRTQKKVDWRKTVFIAELWTPQTVEGETRLAIQVTSFGPEKNMPFSDPALQTRTEMQEDRLVITVQAKRLARFIELSLPGGDARFSDNFFDLPAGRSQTVECLLPPGWMAEEASAALRIRSLVDIKPRHSLASSNWNGTLAFYKSLVGLITGYLIR
jgi:beta-mannosidase